MDITDAIRLSRAASQKTPGAVAPVLEKYIGAAEFSNGKPLPDPIKTLVQQRDGPDKLTWCGVVYWIVMFPLIFLAIAGSFAVNLSAPLLLSTKPHFDDACIAFGLWQWLYLCLAFCAIPGLWLAVYWLAYIKRKLQAQWDSSMACHVNCLYWLYIEDHSSRKVSEGLERGLLVQSPVAVVHSFSVLADTEGCPSACWDVTVFSDGSFVQTERKKTMLSCYLA